MNYSPGSYLEFFFTVLCKEGQHFWLLEDGGAWWLYAMRQQRWDARNVDEGPRCHFGFEAGRRNSY